MRMHGTSIVTLLALLFTVGCFGYGAVMYWNNGQYVLAILFVICACVFLVAALGRSRHAHVLSHTSSEVARLKTSGKKITTTFIALDRRWNVQVNGQSPIVVYSQGIDPQTKRMRTFESEDLWLSGGDASLYGDPLFQAWQRLQHTDAPHGYTIPVYIDLNDSHQYFMDVVEARRIQTKK